MCFLLLPFSPASAALQSAFKLNHDLFPFYPKSYSVLWCFPHCGTAGSPGFFTRSGRRCPGSHLEINCSTDRSPDYFTRSGGAQTERLCFQRNSAKCTTKTAWNHMSSFFISMFSSVLKDPSRDSTTLQTLHRVSIETTDGEGLFTHRKFK